MISVWETASALPATMLTMAPTINSVCAASTAAKNSGVKTVSEIRISAYAKVVETSAEMNPLTLSGEGLGLPGVEREHGSLDE